jgi:hypothetical protein
MKQDSKHGTHMMPLDSCFDTHLLLYRFAAKAWLSCCQTIINNAHTSFDFISTHDFELLA